MEQEFRVDVNGRQAALSTHPDRPLLEVLRETLGLTGTKYGCGEGDCGACTVLMDGTAVRSCITAVEEADGRKITTIEGLATGDKLHPLQEAFIEKHAVQCGYCVPGQILTAAALLAEARHPNREEIIEAMSGNICRCCNYVNILAAVERAVELSQSGSEP
jgi:aerobic-type carbon monoxide dehydrogenase small subunit (CoxS/CutS family)